MTARRCSHLDKRFCDEICLASPHVSEGASSLVKPLWNSPAQQGAFGSNGGRVRRHRGRPSPQGAPSGARSLSERLEGLTIRLEKKAERGTSGWGPGTPAVTFCLCLFRTLHHAAGERRRQVGALANNVQSWRATSGSRGDEEETGRGPNGHDPEFEGGEQ
jgi:hypothetical protein